jgi:transcriptional regulator with XRE-family HTH domain
MQSLANAVGISRSTASRFFAGRSTSLAVTLRILDALHLAFADVATPEDDEEDDDESGDSRARDEWPAA